jgi:hypothetical protein
VNWIALTVGIAAMALAAWYSRMLVGIVRMMWIADREAFDNFERCALSAYCALVTLALWGGSFAALAAA